LDGETPSAIRNELERRWSAMTRCEIVVVVHPLHHRGQPLDAHAGVDRGARQLPPGPIGELLILHEHQVPDLGEPVAILVGGAGRAASDVRAVVVEDLRTGAARAGVAHRPEIVRRIDADDLLVRQASDLAPKGGRVLVRGVDRDQEPAGIDGEILGYQPPGQGDGVFLEIVAKGEVPQHFEKGVVPGGVADIVQVIVLATGAHALLRRGRTGRRRGLLAGEDVLERHHAGVDEQQGGVAPRHQRSRSDDGVIALTEITQKGAADLVQAWHRVSGSKRRPAT
jgi:hypothetical protein